MAKNYSPLWELTLARLRELFREPGIIFWVFGFPVLMAVGLGIAFRESPPATPQIAVVTGTAWLSRALDGDEVESQLLSDAEAREALRSGRVDLLVAAQVNDGQRAVVFRYDPKNPDSRLARLVVNDALQRSLGRADAVNSEDQAVTEVGARYIDFLLPGLIGLNLMGSSMWGIAYSLVLNRKRRQLKRMAATPMRRSHYLLAYLLSRLLMLGLEVGALLGCGYLIFGVQTQGSLLAVGFLCALGAASFAGLGLVIAARIESTEVASGWMNFVMLPMWLLSGSFFAYTRFPDMVQPLIKLLPLTAVNDALRGVMNHGDSLFAFMPEVTLLAFWGCVSFLVALKRFRWQ